MREQIMGMITPTMSIVFFAVFLIMWWRGKMGNYVLGFASAYLLFAIGFGTTHLFDTGSPYVFHITQFFYSLSTATAIWALTKRAGQPPYRSLHQSEGRKEVPLSCFKEDRTN